MGTLLFPGNDADLDIPEAAFLEQLVQLNFTETKPVVRVKFTRFLESMTQEIENHQTASAFQKPVSSVNGPLGMNGVVQGLAEDCEVDAVLRDRRIFNITQPVLKVFEPMLLCQLRSELDHLRRIIDGNNFTSSFGQKLR